MSPEGTYVLISFALAVFSTPSLLIWSAPRSFAVVIQQLPNPLRDAICIFYLVLRGLDTVEDDMALSDEIKLPALLSFHKKIYQRCVTACYACTSCGCMDTLPW